MKRSQAWLCLPVIVADTADVCVTLLGQPRRYWDGGYAIVRESAPTWRWFLRWHPLAFVGAFLVYLAVICAVIVCLPRRLAMILALTMVLAHTWGAVSWFEPLRISYYWTPVAFAGVAALTVLSFERAGRRPAEFLQGGDGPGIGEAAGTE